jgi:hypothetical protein
MLSLSLRAVEVPMRFFWLLAVVTDFHQCEPAMSWPWPSFSHALRIASFILLMCAAVSGSVVANTS